MAKTTKKKVTKKASATSAAEEKAAKIAAARSEAKAAAEKVKEAEKAAAAAKKAEEKAKRDAEKEAEKARKEAAHTKFVAATEKALAKQAQQINARMVAIERAEKKTDDHRLAAAIEIATAKDKCREAKLNFKEWCEANLKLPPKEEGGEPRKLGYESIRKLLPIGAAENENEGAGMKMLEDMRTANAARNRELRERQRQERQEQTGDGGDTTPGATNNEPTDNTGTVDKLRKLADDLERAEWDEFMSEQAKLADKKIVNVDDEVITNPEGSAPKTKLKRAETAFGRLSAKQKLAFASWVAEQVGGTLAMDEGEESEDEGEESEDEGEESEDEDEEEEETETED